ncbi:hypothetical protein AK812_SmicGene22938 [Symbiodinium microadriaticum]|uniref:Uncharacterized protein n=1 Tax=Symbiodinium microadriaticum TaxID=2951 RepID=A0A1Q9DIE0_SYMMI|nr:hypothetical protein AK812_SmicGene22938 [Symbiodinium microadriaticum]
MILASHPNRITPAVVNGHPIQFSSSTDASTWCLTSCPPAWRAELRISEASAALCRQPENAHAAVLPAMERPPVRTRPTPRCRSARRSVNSDGHSGSWSVR